MAQPTYLLNPNGIVFIPMQRYPLAGLCSKYCVNFADGTSFMRLHLKPRLFWTIGVPLGLQFAEL